MSVEYPGSSSQNLGNSPSGQKAKSSQTPNRGDVSHAEFAAPAGVVSSGLASAHHVFAKTGEAIVEPVRIGDINAVPVSLRINGHQQDLSLDPRVTLLDLLRENLGLTGTKKGCDHGQCGACTVLVNGRRINSCLSLAVTHEGDEITTVEGLAQGEQLHPVQSAFLECDGFQCGYCTPGQICSAVALLAEARNGDASFVTEDITSSESVELTPDEIRERMSGNICRCGAYTGIVEALQQVYWQSSTDKRQMKP